MNTVDEEPAGIIVPGPELKEKIERAAAGFSKRDKRKAEELMAKLLSNPSKRNEFLYLETSHVFYPFFLSKLNEYRSHPELLQTVEKGNKEQENTTKGGTAASTTVLSSGIVRKEGGTAGLKNDPEVQELMRKTEIEAQRYQRDPFPSLYSMDLNNGTMEMPAAIASIMCWTAQYAAKYGEPFLIKIQSKYRKNPSFRFLEQEDIRNTVFIELIESYKRILNHDVDAVEDRLEQLQSSEYVLTTLCAEKTKYARAAKARQKAALLTDDELREKLEWNVFSVVERFKLSDLGLDGPIPDSVMALRQSQNKGAEQSEEAKDADVKENHPSGADNTLLPPGAPVYTPTFMSSKLVKPSSTPRSTTDGLVNEERDPTAVYNVVVDENYRDQVSVPVRRTVDSFVDAETGRRVRNAQGDQSSNRSAYDGSQKRTDREDFGLATAEEYERTMKRSKPEA